MVFHRFNLTQLISEPWIQHEISRYLEISLKMLEKWTSPELIRVSSPTSLLCWDLVYQTRHGRMFSSSAGAEC